ncbi:MAG TPA: alpha/beta hydrolase [Acidothermaceae bacterium]|jgi:pimeloyl-ACP methyl ester carboxylesterase
MAATFILIHSPFLGPMTWQSTADALKSRGRRVRVPGLLAVAQSAPPYWPAGVDSIVRSAADDQVILVPHSNGGLYVPSVVEALGERVRGVVFVDAALPGAGHHTTPDFLRKLATVGGLLPPWTAWWPEPDVAALFPDAHVRAAVEAEQPRMPLAYYEHLPPAPPDWPVSPAGYIWFGQPYDKGVAEAEAHGWPTVHLSGGHLHMLSDPNAVATAVLEMAGDWL